MQTVLYLGRFQPFHNGHLWMMQEFQKQYHLKVAIGSAQDHVDDPQNPFSVELREQMIRCATEACGLDLGVLYRVADIPEDDLYVSHVEDICGHFDVIASAEEDWTRQLFIDAGYPCIYLGRHEDISATEVRRRMSSGEDWKSLVPDSNASLLERIIGSA